MMAHSVRPIRGSIGVSVVVRTWRSQHCLPSGWLPLKPVIVPGLSCASMGGEQFVPVNCLSSDRQGGFELFS